jgi:hypothetical protein
MTNMTYTRTPIPTQFCSGVYVWFGPKYGLDARIGVTAWNETFGDTAVRAKT